MHKLIDQDGQEHFYHSISEITSVVDLKQGFQYVFVQEKNNITIWQVVNDDVNALQKVTIDLTDYYQKALDRNFDSMQKKLLYL